MAESDCEDKKYFDVWNLRHQAILFCGDEPDVKQILFTPDEQRFLTVSHKVIRTFEMSNKY